MPFEIIIKETGTETKIVNGEWTKIDTTFFTKEDIEKLSWMERQKIENSDFLSAQKPVMGYSPKAEKVVSFEREVYKQIVANLYLSKVIKAINDI